MSLRQHLKKITAIKALYDKAVSLNIILRDKVRQPTIRKRIKQKLEAGEPINVVLYIDHGAVWGIFNNLWEEINKDPRFRGIVIAGPKITLQGAANPKQWAQHIESNNVGEFLQSLGIEYHQAYDEKTGKLFDLAALKPDIIFPCKPYFKFNPPPFWTREMRKQALLCYINYGVLMADVKKVSYLSFYNLRYYDYVFAESPLHVPCFKDEKNKLHRGGATQILSLGYPKFDLAAGHPWSSFEPQKEVILYTPRWNTNAGECSFLNYHPLFMQRLQDKPEINYIFRPHPNMKNFFEDNVWGDEKWATEMQKIHDNPRARLDLSSDYYKAFDEATVMVADLTSVIAEFLFTGRPVIYTSGDSWQKLNPWSEMLISACYQAHNERELQELLDMLRRGEDPLKQRRIDVTKKAYSITEQGSSKAMLEQVLSDCQ